MGGRAVLSVRTSPELNQYIYPTLASGLAVERGTYEWRNRPPNGPKINRPRWCIFQNRQNRRDREERGEEAPLHTRLVACQLAFLFRANLVQNYTTTVAACPSIIDHRPSTTHLCRLLEVLLLPIVSKLSPHHLRARNANPWNEARRGAHAITRKREK